MAVPTTTYAQFRQGTYIAHGRHGTVYSLVTDPYAVVKLFDRRGAVEMKRRYEEQLQFYQHNSHTGLLPKIRGAGICSDAPIPFMVFDRLIYPAWTVPRRILRKGPLRNLLLQASLHIEPQNVIWQDLLTPGNFAISRDGLSVRFFEGGTPFPEGRAGSIPYCARLSAP